MLEQDITTIRKERHSKTQEDFTPECVLNEMFKDIDTSLFTDFTKTFCDPCIGTGNIYLYVLNNRLKYCNTTEDIYNALSTMYGVELMEDNVIECKYRIIELLSKYNIDIQTVNKIIDNNIVCSDFFEWDFEKWCKKLNS